MATPEGRVKKAIKDVLDLGGDDVRYTMPVPYGYGESTVDFIGCVRGKALAIEAKRPGEEPTPLQWNFLQEWQAAGGVSMVISSASKAALGPLRSFILEDVVPRPLVFPEEEIL